MAAQEIKLSADAEERLILKLEEMCEIAEDYRTSSNWSDVHEMNWEQYLCVPEVEQKNFPFKNSSNLFTPLTMSSVNGHLAQEFDATLSNTPIVKVVSMESSDEIDAQILSSYYGDYYYTKVVPLQEFGADWTLNNCVDGTSAIKIRQRADYRVVREQRVIDSVRQKMEKITVGDVVQEIMVPGESEMRVVEDARVERVDSTVPDLCDLEMIYVAPDTGTSFQWPECRWYYSENELTWEDLLERRKMGYKVDDDFKPFCVETELGEKEKVKREKTGISTSTREKTITVREYFMRWPLPSKFQRAYKPEDWDETPKSIDQTGDDEEGFWEEIVVTYAVQPAKIMRLRPLWRVCPDGKRPHIRMAFRQIPNFFYGIGIPEMLRAIQRAHNTSYNQFTDINTLAAAPWGFYNPATMGVMPEILSLNPGTLYPTLDPRGVNFPRLQSDPQWQLMNQQQLMGFAERLTAWGDPQAGRNPTTPNAQRTFRGMAMQIQQSNTIFSHMIKLHVASFVEMFRKIHAYRRRWAPPEEIFTVTNKENGALRRGKITRNVFDTDVDFDFVLNPNRMAEFQLNMQLFQLAGSVQAIASDPMAMRQLLADLWESSGKKGFDLIWPKDKPIGPVQGPPPGPPQGPPQPGMEGLPPEMSLPGAEMAGGIGSAPMMGPIGPPGV